MNFGHKRSGQRGSGQTPAGTGRVDKEKADKLRQI